MNYKLYTLILTFCTLAATPALQAMKATRSLLATARSLRPAIYTGNHALSQTQFNQNNDHGYHQEEPRYAYGNHSIPTAAAMAVGLGLNVQQPVEETEYSESTPAMDIANVKAIVEFLKSASPEEQQTIVKAIADNLENYSKSDIWIIVGYILNINTQKVLIPAFITMLEKDFNKGDPLILSKLLDNVDEQDQKIITRIISSNIDKMDLEETFRLLIKLHEENKILILHSFFDHIFKSENQADYNKVFEHAIWNLIHFIGILENHSNMNILVQNILKKLIPEEDAIIDRYFKQQDTAATQALFEISCTQSPASLILLCIFGNAQTQEELRLLMDAKIATFISGIDPKIQSVQHLKHNRLFAWIEFIKILNNPKHRAVFKNALEYEQKISDEMAVFYHSQKSPMLWLELLYSKLWEQKYQQKQNDYLFTRFPHDSTPFANAVLQSHAEHIKAHLMEKGRKNYTEEEMRLYLFDELRPYLLFANYALFANGSDWGSSTAYYYLNNYNSGEPEINTQSVLDSFNIHELSTTYINELEILAEEFKNLTSGSILMQLCVPHKILNNHLYLAEPWGFKKETKVNGKEISDVANIINALKNAPLTIENSDKQEFCFVMTPDTVHSLRQQGAQVNVYGDFDQEKLNALIAKLEALIARIAQENPQKFSSKLSPAQSYQAFKPILDNLMNKKD